MLEIIYFILFITYICLIFTFDNFIIQGLFLCINLFFMILLKISFKRTIINLKSLLPIIIFTGFFNLILGTLYHAILVIIKLTLVCNITFIYKNTLGIAKIINTIEKIFLPLKFLGISSTDISLMIHIALTFIPTFIKELDEMHISLLSKTTNKFSANYIKYISKLLLTSTFKKTNDLELALKSKGYYE